MIWYNMYGVDIKYEMILPGRKWLVIAPHPDDEVIGCGGTILKAIDYGIQISILFLTDGEKGGRGDAEEIRRIRRTEAMTIWQEALGVSVYFSGLADSAIRSDDDSVSNIYRYICHIQPDTILVPHIMEQHMDHRLSNELLAKALNKSDKKYEIVAYEVWTSIYPNVAINITDYYRAKVGLIQQYRSQMDFFDYAELVYLHNRKNSLVYNYFAEDGAKILLRERKYRLKRGMDLHEQWSYAEVYQVLPSDIYLEQIGNLWTTPKK